MRLLGLRFGGPQVALPARWRNKTQQWLVSWLHTLVLSSEPGSSCRGQLVRVSCIARERDKRCHLAALHSRGGWAGRELTSLRLLSDHSLWLPLQPWSGGGGDHVPEPLPGGRGPGRQGCHLRGRKQPGRQWARSSSHSDSSRLQLPSCLPLILQAHSLAPQGDPVSQQQLEASHAPLPTTPSQGSVSIAESWRGHPIG